VQTVVVFLLDLMEVVEGVYTRVAPSHGWYGLRFNEPAPFHLSSTQLQSCVQYNTSQPCRVDYACVSSLSWWVLC